ncbi:N-acetylmuramoyl-L-alanine amidase [Streptomyces sp. NPDC020801]|uniref:N-acetylmuramoyl-L-alanine amidase n=1 Tax=unclassified Streptomyces TaxID=2593676 RepID=UPI0037AD81A1
MNGSDPNLTAESHPFMRLGSQPIGIGTLPAEDGTLSRRQRKHRRSHVRVSLGIAGVLAFSAAAGVTVIAQANQSGGPQPYALQREFATAAQDFGVPPPVLMAVAYQQSGWDTHGGRPSTTGNYNVMGLTQVTPAEVRAPSAKDRLTELNMRGDDRRGSFHPDQGVLADVGAMQTSAPALHTLDAAAKLIGAPASALRSDARQSIRGGAALLAQYEHEATGGLPADPARWYRAVERFSQSPDSQGAAQFAQRVYLHIRQGIDRVTAEGQQVALPAQPSLRPRTATPTSLAVTANTANHTTTGVAAAARASTTTTPKPECPSGLVCNFVPAAYAQDDPNDKSSYGNYDIANRPADGDAIKYIVIHDTEGSYASTVNQFKDPTAYASAHYVIRSNDGLVTQMVQDKNVAWHAGNKYLNMHSIGIEHEGFAISGASWYTESEYESSSALVKYLAARYNVPLDREHIIGHDNVPGPADTYVAGQHWDPGPFWDWTHYMQLLGAPIGSSPAGATLEAGELIKIAPPFTSANQPPVAGADPQPANFVYLRTGPSSSDPLLSDPYLRSSGAGTDAGSDWGDKATAGQEFVVAAQQGDWTAIWYGGQEAWFDNPHGKWTVPVTSTTQKLISPKDGATSIPVYGRAYPEASAYPSTIAAQPVTALSKYAIAAGQRYVALAVETSEFYNTVNIDHSAPDDDKVVTGTTTYYPIQYNHRLAYVKAADVKVARRVSPCASATALSADTRWPSVASGKPSAQPSQSAKPTRVPEPTDCLADSKLEPASVLRLTVSGLLGEIVAGSGWHTLTFTVANPSDNALGRVQWATVVDNFLVTHARIQYFDAAKKTWVSLKEHVGTGTVFSETSLGAHQKVDVHLRLSVDAKAPKHASAAFGFAGYIDAKQYYVHDLFRAYDFTVVPVGSSAGTPTVAEPKPTVKPPAMVKVQEGGATELRPTGTLAQTGASSALPLIAGIGGAVLVVGIATVVILRRIKPGGAAA